MFARQIGRNVKVYMDDMLVKSIWDDDHLMIEKFLGFMVSQRGVEVNPDKI